MKKYIKYKAAFTLAEVLITLLIIGVVSSLVLPSIIQDTQDAELKTAWKKAYADISQAAINIKSDLGGVFEFVDSYDLRDRYLTYLNYQTSCSGASWGGNCWHKPGGIRNYSGYYLTAADMNNSFANSPAGILANGNLIMFCRWDYDSTGFWGWIDVDVNGFKGPNTIGKDIFSIWILNNQLQPSGSPTSRHPGTCPSNGGWACSANYLYN